MLANSIFIDEFFLSSRVEMRSALHFTISILFAVFLPAVTMHSWAEAQAPHGRAVAHAADRAGTGDPGKYLAALGLLTVLSASLPIVVMLEVLGNPDLGLICAGYLGVFGLGALFLAAGMLLSAIATDQIVAFVTTTLLCFFLVLSGNDKVVAVLDGLFPKLAPGTLLKDAVSVVPPYDAFVSGSVELAAVVYFAGFAAVFLWLTGVVLERNRE
ncbi:MAG: hypothetical protein U1E76_03550 [Planctomycetota bacterium]